MRQLLCLIVSTWGLLVTTLALGEPASRCFKNIGLRDTYTISFTIAADKVSGVFAVEDDAGTKKDYPFTGSLHNKRLTVNFPGKSLPAILAKKRPIIWELRPGAGSEALRIPIYGQNYQTKKFSTYDITLEHCAAPTAPAAP